MKICLIYFQVVSADPTFQRAKGVPADQTASAATLVSERKSNPTAKRARVRKYSTFSLILPNAGKLMVSLLLGFKGIIIFCDKHILICNRTHPQLIQI